MCMAYRHTNNVYVKTKQQLSYWSLSRHTSIDSTLAAEPTHTEKCITLSSHIDRMALDLHRIRMIYIMRARVHVCVCIDT